MDPWVEKIPWRRKWQPTPVFLPGESHGQRSLDGCSPCSCEESDMTEQLTRSLSFPKIRTNKMRPAPNKSTKQNIPKTKKSNFFPFEVIISKSWRRQWHPTPVLLPGKSHGWRSLGGCSPWGCEELVTPE